MGPWTKAPRLGHAQSQRLESIIKKSAACQGAREEAMSTSQVQSGEVVSSFVASSNQTVFSGGIAVDTIVSAQISTWKPKQIVSDGGKEIGTILHHNGEQHILSGAVASGTIVSLGASQLVSSGGVASGGTIYAGKAGCCYGGQFVFSCCSTFDVIVSSGGAHILGYDDIFYTKFYEGFTSGTMLYS